MLSASMRDAGDRSGGGGCSTSLVRGLAGDLGVPESMQTSGRPPPPIGEAMACTTQHPRPPDGFPFVALYHPALHSTAPLAWENP
jgi:hypothetical protein